MFNNICIIYVSKLQFLIIYIICNKTQKYISLGFMRYLTCVYSYIFYNLCVENQEFILNWKKNNK